jgi:hypothetical protein
MGLAPSDLAFVPQIIKEFFSPFFATVHLIYVFVAKFCFLSPLHSKAWRIYEYDIIGI